MLLRIAASISLCAALLAPAIASAATFEVSPLKLNVATFGDVTVTNTSSEPVRFSIDAYAWSQTPSEREHRSASDAIAYFPQVFALSPGASQRVRISLDSRPGATEGAYRLFITELPPFDRNANGQKLLILSRIDIPVFEPPAVNGSTLPRIDHLSAVADKISALVSNDGTVHVAPSRVELIARDASGTGIWSSGSDVWYVLAQSRQLVNARVPNSVCARIRSVSASWNAAGRTVSQTFATPAGVCR
jgi:P pilus assembly chaperone PapD